jgi:RNA polymerase sigma-70 factor (ECF subfamily)
LVVFVLQVARAEQSRVPEGGDDQTLMELVARGDTAALDVLYARHAPLVFALCLRIVRSRPEAEEVLQEVFWELWRSGDRYLAERGSVRVYLVQLARSRALDLLRMRRRRENLLASAGGPTVIAAETRGEDMNKGALAAAIVGEDSQRVRSALRVLSDAERCVVMLAYFDGLSQSEIAARLGEPLGTVKTRTRRALMRLRGMLVDGNEGGAN